MVIDEDDVFLEGETILRTTLTGEPVSMIKDVSGIADKIASDEKSFTVENEIAVLEAVKRFSKAQLVYSSQSSTPIESGILDTTAGNLDEIKTTMSLDTFKYSEETKTNVLETDRAATEKIVWLGTWASKSNMYCRVRVREYFKCAQGDIDTEAYIGLVNRGGNWLVVSYDRILDSQIAGQEISDKNCLTHDYLSAESTSNYTMPNAEDLGVNASTGATNDVTNTDDGTAADVLTFDLPLAKDLVEVTSTSAKRITDTAGNIVPEDEADLLKTKPAGGNTQSPEADDNETAGGVVPAVPEVEGTEDNMNSDTNIPENEGTEAAPVIGPVN